MHAQFALLWRQITDDASSFDSAIHIFIIAKQTTEQPTNRSLKVEAGGEWQPRSSAQQLYVGDGNATIDHPAKPIQSGKSSLLHIELRTNTATQTTNTIIGAKISSTSISSVALHSPQAFSRNYPHPSWTRSYSQMDDDMEYMENYRLGGSHPVVLGDTFNNRYTVVHKLGQGGFATVWLVWDQMENR